MKNVLPPILQRLGFGLMLALALGVPVEAQLILDPGSFTSAPVGSPAITGSATPVEGGYTITGAGTNISGASDQFQFFYQSVAGDFDVAMRVESLTLSDAWANAGLMARETLTGPSRYAASMATPGTAGSYLQFRQTNAVESQTRGSFPNTYPNLWLRLKRVGTNFTGYAGIDGTSWSQLGTVGISFPAGSSLFVGLAVCSHNASQLATAQFRGLNNVAGNPASTSVTLRREPLGPSSRRTELVISEIMYHPRAYPGLSSLEFIEVFNSQAFDEKIGGYRISGSVDYTFPANTVIKSGQFLVVARDPSAIQAHYGFTPLGPWVGASTNNLPGGSGTVRLRNRQGAVLLEVNYEGRNPWPIAADGAGHSLVLAKPSYGEGDPRAWAASESIDGSPGRDDNYVTDTLSPVVINEILAHTEPSLSGVEDYLELYNHGNTVLDLSGAWLSDKGDTNKYRIPDGTTLPSRGFKAFTESTLGFALSAAGGRVFLVNSNQNRVIDCIDYAAQANGVSLGRYPDGADAFYPMANRTPEAANGAYFQSPVVLNELMYAPISGDNNDEYIELYNRTSNPVDLGYWRFSSGVSLTFPTNTIIPAHGYLVVAKNATNLFAHYANLNKDNTVGNYGGTLANGGERVALSRPEAWATVDTNDVPITNIIYVVMNEVTYGDGGRWGVWADGGGSSLELVDPESDTRQAANWADSDEQGKSEWTSFEFNGPTGETLSYNGDRIQLFLLGIGECLVDDVEVRLAGGTNLVNNSSFEQGTTGWLLQGSHDFSTIEDGGFSGTKCLHLRAASRGDNGPNRVQNTSLSPVANGNVTLRAKAKWVRGWPELLLRTRGGGAEVTGHLPTPLNLGTPGAPNSRRLPNAGPAIYEVKHSPALPQASETVVVTCRVTDPNGIGSVSLRYRVDNGATAVTPAMFTARTMLDSGILGDAIAGDGIYSATLPGQPANGSISFYIEAVDSLGATNRFPQDVFPPPGLPRCFPNDAIARECVVRWGEVMMPGSFATYHLWLTYANSNRWASRFPNLNNAQIDGTFAYNNSRVVYNSLPLYAGSPWHRGAMTTGPSGANRVDFVQNFPSDDRLLGNTDFVLNNPGNPGSPTAADTSDLSAQTEQTSYMIFNEIGLVYNHRRYVHYFVNGSQRSTTSNRPGNFIFEDSQQPNGDMIAEWFPDDTGGNLYKIEDWFEFPDDGSNFASNNDADLLRRTINQGGTNVLTTAPYRFMFRARSVGPGESSSDYDPFFEIINNISPTAAYGASGTAAASNSFPVPNPTALQSVVDVDQFMRVFACQHTIGNWDSYGYERGKNDYTYKPERGEFQQMTWDIDFTMGVGGHGTTQTIWDSNDPRVYGMWNTPVFMRMMWRAFGDIINGPLNNSFLDPILDQKHAALRANGVNVDPTVVATIKSFITGRRGFLAGELGKVSGGYGLFGPTSITTNGNMITLRGGAPYTVADFAVSINGGPTNIYPVTWTGTGALLPSGNGAFQYSVTNWSMRFVLPAGVSSIRIVGLDRLGRPMAGVGSVVTAESTAPPVDPVGVIIFNEIMYQPSVAGAEYIEFYNKSDYAFDLTGWRVNGLDFTFPVGSIITNKQYFVLAKNSAAYSSTYTNSPPVFGQFDGNLDPDGETLTLIKPAADGHPDTVINRVRYENRLPWGPLANGSGPSLQLIDAAQDNSRSSDWADHEDWHYVTFTANLTFNIDTNFLFWLAASNMDVYVDDVVLVTGVVAQVGQNLLRNGGFEEPMAGSPVDGWFPLGNHVRSVISTDFSHSGNASLHIISDGAGGPPSSVRQDIPAQLTNTPATVSFWYKPTTSATLLTVRCRNGSQFNANFNVRPVVATPGLANTTLDFLPAYDPVWLNELQPENVTGPADNFGEREPWIELYNAGDTPINLSGYYLADNYDANLTQWQFPPGTSIGAKEFKIVWADGQAGQTAGNNLHTSFRLNSTTGAVALVRIVSNKPQITDYLTYEGIGPDQSYGDYPDGQPFHRQMFIDVTPGGTNIARFVDVLINEWMASNTNAVQDPADLKYDDWFELYNAGSTPVDLGGFYLTDSPGNGNSFFQVPTNHQYVIPPQGFLLVWADGDTAENTPDNIDLHVPFQLAKSGDSIALIAPDHETVIDRVDFLEQTDDATQGRLPDGNAHIQALGVPTPRGANVGAGGNTPPQIAPIQSRSIRLGQSVSLTVSASDSDVPAQSLVFDLVPGFPAGAHIDANSGLFTWTPSTNQAPSTNNITVRVTDNGAPPLSSTRTFTVFVLLPPHVGISRPVAGQVGLVFDTIPGRTYQIQYKDHLSDAQWQDLKAPEVAVGNVLTASDTINSSPQRFYRVVQLD